MKTIYRPNSIIWKLMPKREFDKNAKYKKTEYLSVIKCIEGYALLNTLTCELLYLDDNEYEMFEDESLGINEKAYLVEHNYYVTIDCQEKIFANQIFNVIENLEKTYKKKKISFFVILTTTGCNARCFYCFEKGAKISTMTPQTAEDVAAFIIKNAAKNITIQWFGGEPLINTNVIDKISKKLNDANIDYKSTMVSNGYLFDTKMINKAKELWKLDKVQITLDGTEEVYNKIKNYVYKEDNSPFKRVLNNIEILLESDIRVSIRLNIDEHNADDLFALSEILVKKFRKFPKCYIYPCPLFDCSLQGASAVHNRDRHTTIEKTMALRDFLSKNMPTPAIERLAGEFKLPSCMANSDSATMIVPDGHLGKCEHFIDRDFYGSIYSDDYDIEKIIRYKERAIVSDECKACKYYVQCMHLKCCTGARTSCSEYDKIALENRLFSNIRNICSCYFQKQENRGAE